MAIMRNCAECRGKMCGNCGQKDPDHPTMNAIMASNVQTAKETIQHMPKYMKKRKRNFNHQT